jgi:hypothetical protein
MIAKIRNCAFHAAERDQGIAESSFDIRPTLF